MLPRISDLRVHQAQQHGIIVGLPAPFAEEVGRLADHLTDCHQWSDVTFLFERDVIPHSPVSWRIEVEGRWWMLFEWAETLGPVAIQLWYDDG